MSDKPYREVILPAGTFRSYDDNPTVWIEVPRTDGFANWFEWSQNNNPTKMKNSH